MLRELMICPTYIVARSYTLLIYSLRGDHRLSQSGKPHQLWLLRKCGIGLGWGSGEKGLSSPNYQLKNGNGVFCHRIS